MKTVADGSARYPMSTRKHCAFCDASDAKISNEHAWPNWIRALFPPTPTTVVGTRPPKKPITFTPRPDNMGVTVNAVCRPCNEGWMEQLETDVRPLLTPMIRDGAQTELTRTQQATLARWVIKTTMVFEFTNNAPPFYSAEERATVRTGGIPGGTLMWMARYEGATFVSTAVAKGLSYDVSVEGNTTRQPGSALTLSAGRFVVQVLSVRPPEGLPGLWVPMPKGFADHVVLLWPSSEGPRWPPATPLRDAELDGFMSRFAPDPD
jgi:hypothetical protein